MLISKNWLSEHIDLSGISDAEIADKLTMIGLEVDGIIHRGSDFRHFSVGYVKKVLAHPNADKLRLCMVDLGDDIVQIVCGAPNVAAGQFVPVARAGAVIPRDMPDGSKLTIKKSKLRGEVSNGMICSEAELELGQDHSGIMVLGHQSADSIHSSDSSNDTTSLKPGLPLTSIVGSTADTVFDIALTPNRPDAASHLGVARDLGAALDLGVAHGYTETQGLEGSEGSENSDIAANSDVEANDRSNSIAINISDTEKCTRYVAVSIEGVTIKPSPDWLKNRLESIGLRSVNNVVDVTNYILHDIGQPLHAFDLDQVRGSTIHVQSFDKKISFTTLDGVEREVPADTLFICDDEGPVAIAGVMGGENSEVTTQTSRILIESAWFAPSAVRRAAKSLSLQTDSSYRFERGIDPAMQAMAALKAAEMIQELAGGVISKSYTDLNVSPFKIKEVDLRPARVNHILGTDLSSAEIQQILNRLNIKTVDGRKDQQSDEGYIHCEIPSYRPDIEREIDLIEEVGRIYDYNKIPSPEMSVYVDSSPLPEWERFVERMRDTAVRLGFREIAGNSLLSRKEASAWLDSNLLIDTLNPVSHETTTLRPTLAAGFLRNASFNMNRRNRSNRFFEIGSIFQKATEDKPGKWIPSVLERTSMLLGISGILSEETWNSSETPFTIFDVKSAFMAFLQQTGLSDSVSEVVLSPRELQYNMGPHEIARLTSPAPEVLSEFGLEKSPTYFIEIDLTELFETKKVTRDVRFKKIPKFPSFEFDAAFIVNQEVRAGEMIETIRTCDLPYLKNIQVFDLYEGDSIGKGKKSVAFRLTFLDPLKTMNINDVEPSVKTIETALMQKYQAKLRSE